MSHINNHHSGSARNSKQGGTQLHSSASELMMKHARKEQMLIAEAVIFT
jgi:hypothetical protein